MWVRAFCYLAAAVAATARGQDAAVEGQVQLPKAAAVSTASNGRYGLAPAGLTGAEAEPPSAVVYLEGQFPAKKSPSSGGAVQMAQQNAKFVPGVLPIQVGTLVEFPNLDDFYHNVFSYSKVKHFDLGRYRKDERPATQLFDKPGVVTLHCEIHEAMRGTILVLDTPYFTKTDASGRFRLDKLPAGRYALKVWLNEKTTLEHPVELQPRAVAHVSFP